MPVKQITINDIYGSDPIGKFVLGKLQITPITAVLFFWLIGVLHSFIFPKIWGYSLEIMDGVNLMNMFLVYPIAVYFYTYQPKRILQIYNCATRFLREEDKENQSHFDKIAKWHARPLWWIIGFIFGLLGASFGIRYSVQHLHEFWYSANFFVIFFIQLMRFLAFYAIGVSACRHIATSIELNNLFQKADFPLTLDTDRFEVFSLVKKFALEFVSVAALIGLNLGLQPLITDPPMPEYAIYVVLYFIVAPICFFLPVWEAHLRMSKIKDEMLDRLNDDFQEESQRIYRKFKKDASLAYIKDSSILASLEKTIQTVSRTPDWPFQGTTIYRLAITVLSPFILVIWDIIINIISNVVVSS